MQRDPVVADGSATTEFEWPIVVCLLGEFRVLKNGQRVVLRGGGKAAALMAALALRTSQGMSRDSLLGTLWPDAEPYLSGQSLSTLVYGLRKLLGGAIGGASPVVQLGGTYRLNTLAGVAVDVVSFEAFAANGDRQMRSGSASLGMTWYARAVELYRGDLQAGTQVHALVQRNRLRGVYLGMLARLADHRFASGEFTAALQYTLQILDNDPFREDAHRMAMRCFVRRGERSAALRQYRLCEQILHTEFDAPPEPATTALFDQVRQNPRAV